MRKVLFYVQVPFLDVNLELIRCLNQVVDLSVLIELPKSQFQANLLSVNAGEVNASGLFPFRDWADKLDLAYLLPYFEHCSDVQVALYTRGTAIETITVAKSIVSYLRKQRFDYLYLDDLSPRQMPLFPFMPWRSMVVNIHDPVPHSGEFEWKRGLLRRIMKKFVPQFVVFSRYCQAQMEGQLTGKSPKVHQLDLIPYTVYRNFKRENGAVAGKQFDFSFVGRISKYKGIENFVAAVATLSARYPDLKFLIAGRPVFNYQIANIEDCGDNVDRIFRHLSKQEMVEHISNSGMIVCPYIEATQSGIVMTALALGKPVLVTDVGGLAEGVEDGINGMVLPDGNTDSLVNALERCVQEALPGRFEKNIAEWNNTQTAYLGNTEKYRSIFN